jgi:hypothetical protein
MIVVVFLKLSLLTSFVILRVVNPHRNPQRVTAPHRCGAVRVAKSSVRAGCGF